LKRVALLTALMTLTLLLTLGSAIAAPSNPGRGVRTTTAHMGRQSTSVDGSLRSSESPIGLLGSGALIPSYSEDDKDGIADSLVLGMLLVVWLVGLVGGPVALCGEPQQLRTIYEYSRLERPG
jgi:hypothetical protein